MNIFVFPWYVTLNQSDIFVNPKNKNPLQACFFKLGVDKYVKVIHSVTMKLKDWQQWKQVSNRKLAGMINNKLIEIESDIRVDETIISHWRSNRRNPSPEVAFIIEQITGRQVKKEELIWPEQENCLKTGN
jgi:hypothetical protein